MPKVTQRVKRLCFWPLVNCWPHSLPETLGVRAGRYPSSWDGMISPQDCGLQFESRKPSCYVGGPNRPEATLGQGFVQLLQGLTRRRTRQLCPVQSPPLPLRAIPTPRGSWNILCLSQDGLKPQGRRGGAVGSHSGWTHSFAYPAGSGKSINQTLK